MPASRKPPLRPAAPAPTLPPSSPTTRAPSRRSSRTQLNPEPPSPTTHTSVSTSPSRVGNTGVWPTSHSGTPRASCATGAPFSWCERMRWERGGALLEVQRQIERRRGVRQRADGDPVDARLGDPAYGVERDAARRLDDRAAGDEGDALG